jgi:hypothetical protein
MQSLNRDDIINALKIVLSIPSHKILVISFFVDFTGQENALEKGLVNECEFGAE